MLATLNLQLAAVELPDETLKTTADLLPTQGAEPAAGFADLLRLRVADGQVQGPASGDLLPLAGSGLPLSPDAETLSLSVQGAPVDDLAAELPVATLPQELMPVDAIDVGADFDIGLESEILYQPELQGLNVPQESIPVAPAAGLPGRMDATTTPSTLDAGAVNPDARRTGMPQPELPPVTLTVNPRESTPGGPQRIEVPIDSSLLRERLPAELTRTAAAAPAVDKTAALPPETERTLPVSPELLKRSEPTASQRADALAQAVTELVRPRPIVNQTVRTLQSQLNPQQSPIFHNPVATTPLAVTDTTYSAAVQQATDLIGTPVRDAAWGDRLGERVVMMAGNQLKNAEIRLTPAELGPLRVQVTMEDGTTNVTFHAQHAVTRDAIEQALPRLRDMLAENGLSLGDAHVGEEGAAQGNRDGQSESETGLSAQSMDEGQQGNSADSPTAARTRISGTGLVDTFA